MSDDLDRTWRWTVGAAIVGSVVLLAPSALDPTMLIKAAAVVVAVAVLTAWWLSGLFAGHRVGIPWGPVPVVLVVFALVVMAATLWSSAPALSFVGAYERYTGGLMYASYAFLGLAVVRGFADGRAPQLVAWVLVASTGLVLYGLLQMAGLDPVGWEGRFGESVIAQLGNPDFVSGYLGIVVPLGIWGAVWSDWGRELRMTAGALVAASVAVLIGSGALQGFVAGAIGVGALTVGVIAARAVRPARVGAVAGGAALVALVVVGLGATGLGPAARLWQVATVRSRTYLWQTAVEMIQAEPLTGVGLSLYGRYYHEFRPLDEAVRRDLGRAADAAHNVLLNLAAGGGLVVALAWVAVAVVTAVVFVGAWRAGDRDRRRLLAALGGAYLAYHAQASVSIDIPPLAVLHVVLVGAIAVTASGPHLRWVTLRDGQQGTVVRWLYTAALAGPMVVIVGLVLRADHLAGRALGDAELGRMDAAVTRIEDAIAIAPWQPAYHFEHARVLAEAGRLRGAVGAMDEVIERDPRDLAAWISRARLLKALERPLEAVEAYTVARGIAPKSPELGVEYAEALLEVGQETLAREVLLGVLAANPDDDEALQLLEQLDGAGSRP